MWAVGVNAEGRCELQRRVGPAVGQLACQDGRAAPLKHLAPAWREVHGRNPSPSEAYREAVRAVESVAIPVVSPNNQRATLGTVIADVKQKPSNGPPASALRHP